MLYLKIPISLFVYVIYVVMSDRQLRVVNQQLREKDELVSAMHKPNESCQGLIWHIFFTRLQPQLIC